MNLIKEIKSIQKENKRLTSLVEELKLELLKSKTTCGILRHSLLLDRVESGVVEGKFQKKPIKSISQAKETCACEYVVVNKNHKVKVRDCETYKKLIK